MGAEKYGICKVGEQAENSEELILRLVSKTYRLELRHDFYVKPFARIMEVGNLSAFKAFN